MVIPMLVPPMDRWLRFGIVRATAREVRAVPMRMVHGADALLREISGEAGG